MFKGLIKILEQIVNRIFFYKLGVSCASRFGLYTERKSIYLLTVLRFLHVLRRDEKCVVLDLGCSDGYFADRVSRFQFHVLAVDIKPSPLWSLRCSSNVDYIVADARRLPLRTGSVDFVYALSLLEHVKGWNLVIEETARVLKKGGLFLIQVPNLMYLIEPHTKFPLLGLMPKTLRRVIASLSGYPDLQFSCTLKNVIRELTRRGFNVLGISPHYHLRILSVLPIAPSYFIVALRNSRVFSKTRKT